MSHNAIRGDASLSQFERALYNQIDDMNYQIESLEEEVDGALRENDQVSASVAALRSMRDQLQEELDALSPLSTDAVEAAKYEANEIKKTMLENELVHAEETLRIVAARIQDLVSQRMQRDADADNYARRVMAMQKLINRPRGVGTTTSAAKELKQLEQENRNLHEQIIELRVATQRNEEPSAVNRTSQQKLSEAQHQKDQLDHDERTLQTSLEARIAQAERDLRLEFHDKLRQLVVRFEGSRMASMVTARNKEEQATMSPKDLLKRALDEARRASRGDAIVKRSTTQSAASGAGDQKQPLPYQQTVSEQISQLATERAKTTSSARLVASQVHRFQTLQDENSALLGLLSKMADEVRATSHSVKDMAEQLEALQGRLKDEASHRQQWIEHDAANLNAALVDSILKKDEELKQLQVQISEWREHADRLQSVSPAVQNVIAQTSLVSRSSGPGTPLRTAANASYLASPQASASRFASASAAPFATSRTAPHHDNIKRSMLLDL
jgi:HAMP domain-containing protein